MTETKKINALKVKIKFEQDFIDSCNERKSTGESYCEFLLSLAKECIEKYKEELKSLSKSRKERLDERIKLNASEEGISIPFWGPSDFQIWEAEQQLKSEGCIGFIEGNNEVDRDAGFWEDSHENRQKMCATSLNQLREVGIF